MLGEGTPSYVTSTRTDHGWSKLLITDAGAPLGCALPVKKIAGAVETIERMWMRLGGSADGSLGNAEGVQRRVGSLCSDQLKQLQRRSQGVYKKQIEQDVE